MFELGEAPPAQGPAPGLVVVEADGTYLFAQREGHRFEVKTGVFYAGKDGAGGRRHRRYRLLDKGCYATTQGADGFGKGLAARGFHWVGLHLARAVLCVHDGLDEFGQTFADWFPRAMHQIDHFHVAERVWQVSGADARRFRRLKSGLLRPPGLRPQAPTRGLRPDQAAELAGYLDAWRQTCTEQPDFPQGSGGAGCASWALGWWRSTRTFWSNAG